MLTIIWMYGIIEVQNQKGGLRMSAPIIIDLTGKRFGRLTVLEMGESRYQPSGKQRIFWKCKCDCGRIKEIDGQSLRSGGTISCGCYRSEHNRESQLKPNIYDLTGEYGVCYFNNGGKFIFDLEDYDKIKEYTWCRRQGGYAGCTRKENGKSKIYNAYRIIMNIDDSRLEVDHINGDKWDNRKCNLRIVTHADNMKNKKLDKRNKSGYTGVKETKAGTWNAQIYCNGKYINLGTYKAKEDAIKARKEAEEKYFGEFTHKNQN